MDKSSSLGLPMSPHEISRRYKRQSLGMPKAGIPFFINKVSGHLSGRYIFIASYAMRCYWSVFFLVFFCFVCCNQLGWILAFLCGRETHSVLIAKNTLVFTLIVLRVFYFSSTAFSSCFSFLFCSELVCFLW